MSANQAFVDTNIWIYLYSDTDPGKKNIAFTAINQYDCYISTQVLNEFCNSCRKKFRMPFAEIREALLQISAACNCAAIDEDTINQALGIQERYGFSYFDCLMIASAIECNCGYLFSEDMRDGQKIDGLTILNIFKENALWESAHKESGL